VRGGGGGGEGLGLKSLRAFNDALLGKWDWKIRS
jgi:hypothetical protein